jgi:hypothetical protein
MTVYISLCIQRSKNTFKFRSQLCYLRVPSSYIMCLYLYVRICIYWYASKNYEA